MNFDVGTIISIVTAIAAISISWGRSGKQAENLSEMDQALKNENQKQWDIITEIREWQRTHEREAADRRLEIEREMSKLRENDGLLSSKMDEIMRLVKTVDGKMDRLEERNDRRDK